MKMTIFKAFGTGLALSLRKAKLLVYLWLANIGAAIVMAAPFFFIMQKELGHSLFGRTAKTFDFLWLGELFYRYQDAAAALTGWMAVPVILYLIVSVFFNGGIIGRIIGRNGKTDLPSFFGDCGQYFWPFFRAFLLSIPVYLIALGGLLRILSAVLDPLIQGAKTEWTPLILRNFHFLVALLLFSLIQMFFGYVKIIIAVENETKVLRVLPRAFRFIKPRIFRAWALTFLTVAVFLGGIVLFFSLSGSLPSSGLLGVALAILWGQLNIVFRLWTRILVFSVEFQYYFGNSD